jgi:hypothetical protein
MSFLNIFKSNSLRQKITNIKKDITKETTNFCDEIFWVEWYGAYDINPKYLVFWIGVDSDK